MAKTLGPFSISVDMQAVCIHKFIKMHKIRFQYNHDLHDQNQGFSSIFSHLIACVFRYLAFVFHIAFVTQDHFLHIFICMLKQCTRERTKALATNNTSIRQTRSFQSFVELCQLQITITKKYDLTTYYKPRQYFATTSRCFQMFSYLLYRTRA